MRRHLAPLFEWKSPGLSWHVPFLAALGVGIPVLLGLWLHQPRQSMLAATGAMVILYLVPVMLSVRAALRRLLGCSTCFVFCYIAAAACAFHPVAAVTALGLLTLLSTTVSRWHRVPPPGSFFPIVIASIASNAHFEPAAIPTNAAWLLSGSLISCALALIYLKFGGGLRPSDESAAPTPADSNINGAFPSNDLKAPTRAAEHPSSMILSSNDFVTDSENPSSFAHVDTHPEHRNDCLRPCHSGSAIGEGSLPLPPHSAVHDSAENQEHPSSLKPAQSNLPAILIESSIIATFVALSLLIARLLHLENPYWVPISCAAILQGGTFRAVWHRNVHRIVGTALGMGLSWFLFPSVPHPVAVVVTMVSLVFVVEYLVTRHYGLAVIFITPMTVCFAEFTSGGVPIHGLFTARLLDIILGSLIGAAGGSILHHPEWCRGIECRLRRLLPDFR
jgi:uncharacterized membrane protein YccC